MGPSCLSWCRDKKKNILGQLGKGERSLQASGRAPVELHKETSRESREQKNLMKKNEMRVRSQEGLKNEEIRVLSEEQLGNSQAWEFWDAGNKVTTGISGSKNRGRARRFRILLYSAFSWAFLEYCTQVLAPQCRKVTRELDGVQGSITGIAGLERPVCVERLLWGTKKAAPVPPVPVEDTQEMLMGCPERLCALHLCRFSRPNWAKARSSLIWS